MTLQNTLFDPGCTDLRLGLFGSLSAVMSIACVPVVSRLVPWVATVHHDFPRPLRKYLYIVGNSSSQDSRCTPALRSDGLFDIVCCPGRWNWNGRNQRCPSDSQPAHHGAQTFQPRLVSNLV